MVRDAVCSQWFGAAVLHYFYIAFLIPNLFRRLFGEGALTAAFIPIYTEQRHKDPAAANRFAQSVVTLLVIFLAAVTLISLTLIYAFIKLSPALSDKIQLTLNLTAIMLPYMILICAVALIGGILNVHRRFGLPAAAPIVLNLCIIIAVIAFSRFFGESKWQQIYVAALAVLISGVIQLVLLIPSLKKSGLSLMPCFLFRQPAIKRMIQLMAPMVVGLAAVQINTLLDSLIAMALSATPESGSQFTIANTTFNYPVSEGVITHLYNAQRLYQFPLGVFGIALATAIFPILSRHAVKNQHDQFSHTFNQGLRLALFIALPTTIGLILVRSPLIRAIFEGGKFTSQDSDYTSQTLLFYTLGIGAYCIQQLVVRAFYSFQDSATPVKIALCMVALNLILNLILIWPLGAGGLALSTAICAAIQTVILLRILLKRYTLSLGQGLFTCLNKTLAATTGMALAGYVVLYYLSDARPVIQLAAAVPTCAAVFTLLAAALKIPELQTLFSRHTLKENS